MIRKIIFSILLSLVFVFAFQPQIRQMWLVFLPQVSAQAASIADEQLPIAAQETGAVRDTLDVTLYYRYADTGLLGAQRATLDIRREETIATAIVTRLIAGVEQTGSRLTGLFPQGTRLISVRGEGVTAFVTLSREFLGKPAGAPSDWEDLTIWQEEAALRRLLAVQSIVMALTEDGRYQRVQLYIADTNDDVPERVPLAYFSLDVQDPGIVLGACSRDESFLLTPQRALERVLLYWQKKEWEAVYDMLAFSQGEMPTPTAFVSQMQTLNVSLLEYETTAGTVSFDGQRATLVLSALTRTPEGGDAKLERESVALVREDGNWAIRYDTLLSLMIRD